MQFRDLKKQYEVLKEPMDTAIQEVSTSVNLPFRKQVSELEDRS